MKCNWEDADMCNRYFEGKCNSPGFCVHMILENVKDISLDKKHAIEQAIYKKAARATIKKLNAVMNGPAYEFEHTLSEYKEYLIRTYHLEKEFPKGVSED